MTSQEVLHIGDQEFKLPKDVQKSLVYKKKYPNLKAIIQWMNRELDHGYKHHITTTVVSRYLSDHFLNVCLYLKRKGFRIDYLDYQPIVFEKIVDGAKFYIDSTKIKVLNGEFVHKNDNAPIAQGKVALSSHTGKITQTFQVGIRFPKALRNDDDKTD